MEISPEELSAESARLSSILPELNDRVARLNAALDAKVAGLIGEGKLTPELALAFWYERQARTTLVRSLLTRVAVTNMGK